MTLGTFTPRTRITGDKIDLRQQQWYNRPMLMRCNEYSDSFNSTLNQKIVEAVWADVVDLASGTILINVLFTSGAVVDNLKETAGTDTALPVKIVKQAGGKFGGYAVLEALTEAEQAQAGQWHAAYWPLVDQERAKREAAARPLQNQNAIPGPAGGIVPVQGAPFNQPQQGFQPGVPSTVNQPFAVPATGQAPPQQFAQPGQYPAHQPQYGQGSGAPTGAPPLQNQAPAQQFAQPQGQAPQQQAAPVQGQPGQPTQGFGQQAPGGAPGMFTDAPPPADPNQGFQAPNAQNMLAQLNNQLQ